MTPRYDILVDAVASRDLICVWLAVIVLLLLAGWWMVAQARGRMVVMRRLYAALMLALWVGALVYFGLVLPLAGWNI